MKQTKLTPLQVFIIGLGLGLALGFTVMSLAWMITNFGY